MKRLTSLILSLALCASLASPALAAEDDFGPTSGEEIGGEMASSVDPHIAPSDAPETAPIDPAPASDPEAPANDTEAPPETGETAPIDPTTEAETTETTAETIDDEIPLVVTFSDVPATHTFYQGITYCASKGIVGGYADGTFRPANTVTRWHFVAFLSRAFCPNEVAKYNNESFKTFGIFMPNFTALDRTYRLSGTAFYNEYCKAMDQLMTADVVNGIMNKGISRYDMAQLMTNIMNKKGFAASASQKTAAQAKITDYKNIPSQYQDAVKNVYALGIIGGYGDGRFVGTNIMNRGQAAIVIQRMAQYAPVKGDQDNDTYDDGTEKNPKPNPTTDTDVADTNNTGNTGTTTPKPETKPETPAANVLTNGKAITESNVKALLDELKAKWNKQDLGTYGQGNASPVRKVTSQYRFTGATGTTSTTAGCGGGAARVFDAVFGQNATLRPVSGGYDAARPGDVLIKLDANGKLMHVAIVYTTNETINGLPGAMTTIDANIGSAGTNKLLFGIGCFDPVKYELGWTYAFYTAYPD